MSDEERRKARFILDAIMQIHRLHDVDFESIVIIKGLADRLLAAAHSGPQRRPKKNLGKPVVDLTGDDREGA